VNGLGPQWPSENHGVTWSPPSLSDHVAVVTGASRGVGKGVAVVLGECGATVFVTGRTSRAAGAGRRTVEDTADEVTARGGSGVPVVTDHTDDAQVEALFDRVRAEAGRLDLLVANAWGGYENYDYRRFGLPFWELPVERFDTMVRAGLRTHLTACRAAAPLMLEQGSGLIVLTGGWDDPGRYLGNVPYDLVKTATSRLVATMAHELRPHGVSVVGVYPGFTTTELVVDAFAAGGAEPPAHAHSPELVGRAVAALAADPDVASLSGSGAQAATYSARYGFTDVDGRNFEPFVLPDENRL
jgi:NAD(P)-dependent dehydrogenase (short-subunit alcohol dehydrogenase family)